MLHRHFLQIHSSSHCFSQNKCIAQPQHQSFTELSHDNIFIIIIASLSDSFNRIHILFNNRLIVGMGSYQYQLQFQWIISVTIINNNNNNTMASILLLVTAQRAVPQPQNVCQPAGQLASQILGSQAAAGCYCQPFQPIATLTGRHQYYRWIPAILPVLLPANGFSYWIGQPSHNSHRKWMVLQVSLIIRTFQ